MSDRKRCKTGGNSMDRSMDKSIKELFNSGKKEARVVTIANFKGGVGKSTLNSVMAYIATEKYGLRVLQIDSDPQVNLTQKMYRTYKVVKQEAKVPFMEGIRKEDLTKSVTKVTDKLDIIKGDWDVAKITEHVHKKLNDQADFYLYQYLIEPLKKDYDLILFDGIPTTGTITNNCVVASDYALMPTQTEEDAYDNTKTYIKYLVTMKQDYNQKLELIGIVPYLVGNDAVDRKVLYKYQTEFPEITFNNLIKHSAKVKTWGSEGITNHKPYDRRTLKMYDLVFQEMIKRMAYLEQN